MEFKGWCWSELMPAFGLTSVDDGEEQDLATMQEFLASMAHIDASWRNVEIMNLCKEYLMVLISQTEKISFSTPIWKGLMEINEPFTFIQYFRTLLPHAWS